MREVSFKFVQQWQGTNTMNLYVPINLRALERKKKYEFLALKCVFEFAFVQEKSCVYFYFAFVLMNSYICRSPYSARGLCPYSQSYTTRPFFICGTWLLLKFASNLLNNSKAQTSVLATQLQLMQYKYTPSVCGLLRLL